jgi:hypothetical protein
MSQRPGPSSLDKRLVGEAVALALHPANVSDIGATHALSRLAEGNRSAIERAIGSVASKLHGEPSHVGQRALDFLRHTLDDLDGQESA